jgi:hypothetical protein
MKNVRVGINLIKQWGRVPPSLTAIVLLPLSLIAMENKSVFASSLYMTGRQDKPTFLHFV